MACANYDGCPETLRSFLIYMGTIRNLSKQTIENYYVDLRGFLRFIKLYYKRVPTQTPYDEIDISDVSQDDIKNVSTETIYEYLNYLMRGLDNGARTRARKVSSLRSFYKYLTVKSHKFEYDPVKDLELPSIRQTTPRFLTLDESESLLDAPEGVFSARDYCILTLFLNCGMRLSELVGINDSDIRDDQVRILGKGDKERMVFLNEACRGAIEEYKKRRDAEKYAKRDPKALFISRTGSRLTGRRVEQIVDDCIARAGLADRGFSPHKLRHTAATLMYRYGDVDMLALKEVLGHAHVSTTEIYTHISDEKLKNATDSNPLARERQKKRPASAASEDPKENTKKTE